MKKIAILIIALVIIGVGFLSGCTTVENNYPFPEDNEVEIVSYSVETQLYIDGESTIESGFIHSDDTIQFNIKGKVKNNAGEMVSKITIESNFYDGNDNFLLTKKKDIYNLADTETEDFEIVYISLDNYFENVEKVEFEIDYEL